MMLVKGNVDPVWWFKENFQKKKTTALELCTTDYGSFPEDSRLKLRLRLKRGRKVVEIFAWVALGF